ncbi:MAG: topoisomerase C-terminal repeat-containing protein, partial [Nitratireductor sp.]
VGTNRAVTVLAEKQAKGGARRGAATVLKDLGEHPDGGGKVTVRDGRYGPYANFGKVNATLPKGKDPAGVTLEEAVALIAEKAGKTKPGGAKKTTKAKKPAAAKTGAKTKKTAKSGGPSDAS